MKIKYYLLTIVLGIVIWFFNYEHKVPEIKNKSQGTSLKSIQLPRPKSRLISPKKLKTKGEEYVSSNDFYKEEIEKLTNLKSQIEKEKPFQHITKNSPSLNPEVKKVIRQRQKYPLKVFKNTYKKGQERVDILWVIDDSNSMRRYQKRLAEKFEVFIQQFLQKKIKFKMAVISTTADKVNESRPKFLTHRSAKRDRLAFIEKFTNEVKVGSEGSGDEKGFLAVNWFLENYGEKFLRRKAEFVIVFVSDSDDHSYDYIKNSEAVKKFITYNKKYKKSFKVYGILKRKKHKRYSKVIKKTKGIIGNIKGNWHQTLLNIGGDIISSIQIDKSDII